MQALGTIPAPPIARTLGFWLVEVGDGTAVFEAETGPHLLNPLGGVHGGWALTLIDSAAGAPGILAPAGVGYTRSRPKQTSRARLHTIPDASAPKAASLAAAARSCPQKRASSIPPAASWPMARRL